MAKDEEMYRYINNDVERLNTLTDNTIAFIKYQCDRYHDASNKAMQVAGVEADKHDWTYEQKIQYAAELIDDFLGERP